MEQLFFGGEISTSQIETLVNFVLSSIIRYTKAKLLLLKLIHLFAREVLLVKKLKVNETKTNYYSFFKTDLRSDLLKKIQLFEMVI